MTNYAAIDKEQNVAGRQSRVGHEVGGGGPRKSQSPRKVLKPQTEEASRIASSPHISLDRAST